MILADKIMKLRKKNGWSQEELAEKLNVSRQAVSKWEGAQSIPDMGRIIQLSELFGVSTDYLLKDELEQTVESQETTPDSLIRTVSMEEANAFLKTKEENARRVALAVMLCILSPAALILLGGAREAGMINWSDNTVGGVGLIILILMVLPAVGLFVASWQRISRFEYLEKEPVETLYGVTGMVRERKEKFQPVHSRHMILGILLCIASLTGCAMTPRFVTAKELLERSRSMQEALTESALEDESMAEEALVGEAYPERGSEGYGDGSGAAEDAGENRTQAGAETNLPEETTDGSSDVDETDAQDAKTVEAVQEIYTPGA